MRPEQVAALVVSGVFVALAISALLLALWLRRMQRVPPSPSEEKLDPTTQALLESIPFPAVVFGESMRRTYVNPAYEEKRSLVRHISRQEWFQRALMDAFLDRMATSRPATVDDPSDVHIMPLPGLKVVAIVTDQGERYRTAALREDFIANASHELNTPAASISLLAEALVRTVPEGSPAEGFATSLVDEAERLADLTRDIVRLSQVQDFDRSKRGENEDQEFDLLESLERVVSEHKALAEQLEVNLEVDVGDTQESVGLQAAGSAYWFEVGIGNLVENAIRYSPMGGHVSIALRHRERRLDVTVSDQGVGIDPEFHQQIFERFYRVEAARTRRGGGTGLGLSIARNAARSMGGDVTVASAPGEGATFTFSIPAEVAVYSPADDREVP